MWIEWHWCPTNVLITPAKPADPTAKVAFQRAVKRLQELTVRLSGRVGYSGERPPTWAMLATAKVWTADDYAPLRQALSTQTPTFTISESPDFETLSLTPI